MNKHSDARAVVATLPVTVATPSASAGAPAADPWHDDLVRRVRGEYLEMPGLALTLGQAQRMWNLRRGECERLLGDLVEAGFLACTPLGMFVRADSGRAGA
jgi:Spy/CpxP family protein refolding chaperone